MTIELTSPAFNNGEPIPKHYTCDGDSSSPPLTWSGIPEDTASIALIAEDPDSHDGPYTHWTIYNLPPEIYQLPEDMGHAKKLPDGSFQGKNDAGKAGYIGSCPRAGRHHYLFKIYALDIRLDLGPGATRAQLEEAMKGHVLDEGQLVGTYVRIPHLSH